MPLMKPEIQAVLREAGLSGQKRSSENGESEKGAVAELLAAAGLDLAQAIENLADTANHSANEAIRVRANETALKMHGALKEATQQGSNVPTFIINISDPFGAGKTSLEEGTMRPSANVNPILLPRQLLAIQKQQQEQVN